MIKRILFIMTIFYCNSSLANNMDYFRELHTIYVDKIHPRIIKQLPSSERKKLENISFVLDENPRNMLLAGTNINNDTIYISVGFLFGLMNYVDCLLLEAKIKNNNICNNYFTKYLFKHVLSDKDYPPYTVTELILNDAQLTQWQNNQALNTSRNVMMFSALTSVMAHEYGHHIIGVSSSDASISEMRTLESNVDQWAFDTLHKIGEKPAIGAVISLGYISQIERYRRELREKFENDVTFRQIPSNHPKPKRRVKWAYNHTCSDTQGNTALESACDLLDNTIKNFE